MASLVTRLSLSLSMLLLASACATDGSGPSPSEPEPGVVEDGGPTAEPDVTDISATLEAVVTANNLPAMGAAIIGPQGVFERGVYGMRSKGAGATAVAADDVWHLGSDTKAMTAALAARMVEAGTIDWSTTVTEIWPEADAAWGTSTLAMLLQHRAGATGSIPADYPQAWSDLYQSESQPGRTAFVQMLTARPPDEPVGTFVYSNASYMVAGAMLEARGGRSWEALMDAEVFGPLSMSSCGFGAPTGDAVIWGHSGAEGTPVPPGPGADNPPGLGPAGTVHCNLDDWGKFLAIFLDDSGTYLSSESLTALTTPEGDYALGWIVATQPWSPGPVVTHVGSNTLWVANAWVSPSLQRAFVAVTNSGQTGAFEATNAVIVDLVERETTRDD